MLGSGFGQLHALFDRFATETRAYVDDVAERALVLGGVARGVEEQRWMLLAHLPGQHPNGVADREAP